jgi:hypothetical protein
MKLLRLIDHLLYRLEDAFGPVPITLMLLGVLLAAVSTLIVILSL